MAKSLSTKPRVAHRLPKPSRTTSTHVDSRRPAERRIRTHFAFSFTALARKVACRLLGTTLISANTAHRRGCRRCFDPRYRPRRPRLSTGLRSGVIDSLCVNRPWGDRPFDTEDRNLVHLFQLEAQPLYAARAPRSNVRRSLTPREKQTLALLLAGAAEKNIADQLALSLHTVHGYVKNIYAQFGVQSRAQLLATCLEKTSSPARDRCRKPCADGQRANSCCRESSSSTRDGQDSLHVLAAEKGLLVCIRQHSPQYDSRLAVAPPEALGSLQTGQTSLMAQGGIGGGHGF